MAGAGVGGSSSFEFHVKTHLVCGPGEALSLPRRLRVMSLARPGIILDPGVRSLGYVKEIFSRFESEAGLEVHPWIYDIRGEPDYDSLDRVSALFRDPGGAPVVDCFVGIGGGSVIDLAKGLATLATNPGPAIRYRGFPEGLRPSLPTIAVPTTAGTGSEVTYNAVFIDRKEQRKLGINTRNNFPALAVLDPHLIASSPAPVLVSSGVDSLIHAVESYAAKGSNTLTRIFAREAFGRTFRGLSRVLGDRENLTVLGDLQLGAYLAGISLMNAGSGPAGALSYPLGVRFGVPHGLAGGVFLPGLVAHNVAGGFDYRELGDIIGTGGGGDFAGVIAGLARDLGIPRDLGAFGVNRVTVEPLLRDVEGLSAAFAQNPVEFTVEDGKRMILGMTRGTEE